MANTDVVLQGVKDYTLELLGTKARDEAVDAATRSESAATRSESAAENAAGDAAATAADRVATGEDRAQTGKDAEAAEGWASQSKDAATLAITAAATVTQYVGDGFPEGKVAAPVGSIYTDTAATNGAIRWIKTSGTGNTGWKVEYGDTGWRNITDLFTPEITSGSVHVRRRTGWLDFQFAYVTTADTETNHVAQLGVMWGPEARSGGELYQALGRTAGRAVIESDGKFFFAQTSTASITSVISFPAPSSWPATYVGTP